jgi:hypothetical protein
MSITTYKFCETDRMIKNRFDNKLLQTYTVYIEVDKENSEKSICKFILKKIENILHDKEHFLRAKESHIKDDNYYYTQEDSKILAKQIVKINKKPLIYEKIRQKIVDYELSAIIRIYNNRICICASHIFVDGLRLFDLIGLCLDNSIINQDTIPKFIYNPILTELSTIPHIPQIMKSITKNNLSVNNDYLLGFKKPLKNIFNENLNDIKYIKNYLSNLYDSFSFPATLSVLAGIYTFETTNKLQINLALIYGFQKEKFIFNNISYIPILLKRPYDWSNICVLDKLKDISHQINTAIKTYVKSAIILYYLKYNFYNLNFNVNKFVNNKSDDNNFVIDLYVSCCPKLNNGTFNGKHFKITFNNLHTASPLYFGFVSYAKILSVNIYNNSDDVNLNKMETLQSKQIIKEIKII